MSDDLFRVLYGDRPELQENCCTYDIFALEQPCTPAQIERFVQPIFAGHLWEHEPFHITSCEGSVHGSAGLHLRGETKFGDNIDDEWFVVHALLEITKHFPQSVVRIADNDGQFLLIEAAEALPDWLSPSTSKNRVFLHGGMVHLILQTVDDAQSLDIDVALRYVRDPFVPTLAVPAINAAIMARADAFPDLAVQNRHRAHCYLPQSVANVIRFHSPQLVAEATRAFYLRTSEDAAACATMPFFKPSPETRVAVCVTFTRCLYAQLVQQEFHAPKPFQEFMQTISGRDFQAADVGMRLACGFEILARKKGEALVLKSTPPTSGNADNDWDGYASSCAEIVEPEDTTEWLRSSARLDKRMGEYGMSSSATATASTAAVGVATSANPASTIDKASQLAKEMKLFVDSTSDYDGVESSSHHTRSRAGSSSDGNHSREREGGDGVHIDLDRFMSILNGGGGGSSGGGGGNILEPNYQAPPAVDPADTDDDLLDQAFEEAMDSELANSSMGSSFITAENIAHNETGGEAKGLAPLDLDVNLISSMLSSFSAQQGLPGPVSNILGDLGFDPPKLPPGRSMHH
jgi:uncharacterized membrane protein YgcG